MYPAKSFSFVKNRHFASRRPHVIVEKKLVCIYSKPRPSEKMYPPKPLFLIVILRHIFPKLLSKNRFRNIRIVLYEICEKRARAQRGNIFSQLYLTPKSSEKGARVARNIFPKWYPICLNCFSAS